MEFVQYSRRCDAINEVPGMQTAAQRSALARAKRKAAAAPRTSLFPDEAAALRQQDAERKRMKPATDEPEVSPPSVEPELTQMPSFQIRFRAEDGQFRVLDGVVRAEVVGSVLCVKHRTGQSIMGRRAGVDADAVLPDSFPCS